MDKEIQALLSLSMVKGIGPVLIRNLIAYCGSAQEVLNTPKAKLQKIPGIGVRTVQLLFEASKMAEKTDKELLYCETHGIDVLAFTEADYPQNLKFIHDAPVILFKKGSVRFNQQTSVAIVGTRKPTDYGRENATFFAQYLAERGINVVSGMAYGIDIAAHKSVLQCGGITTGVLGHGLDIIYPGVHAEKAKQMLEKGGLISEFCSGTKPDMNNFPARNRIIAGLSKAVIVIEAAESGGALITAHFAFDQNREVFAVPGNIDRPYSKGCNKLIRDNIARLVSHPQEVLDELGLGDNKTQEKGLSQESLSLTLLNEDEWKIARALEKADLHIDDLSEKTGFGVSALNVLLLNLEFSGVISQLPGKVFRLMRKNA
ncbi:MAG: DNA-processing protein DprA [Bacteroidia bacterium]|nr:DNA-processing protein DprA [Bacteroidia bacterium]